MDDEARVVEGLVLHLRKDYEVHTALSGDEALKLLKQIGGAAVIVSDMRMPGMDGASLLHRVMSTYPDTTRILLTGEPGRDAAAAAVNKGQIFRFLTKPCPPDQLRAAVEAGVMQHRLVNAERSILKETLIGCIKALIDVLAITNPVAFGRASRVKRLAIEFAMALEWRRLLAARGCRDAVADRLSVIACASRREALQRRSPHGRGRDSGQRRAGSGHDRCWKTFRAWIR